MPARHRENHRTGRLGWLRAAVLGANDGIVSTASLLLGVAAASASRADVLVAGMAALVAGAMSMAAGEYVSVRSQADNERAEIENERLELEADAAAECRELTAIYVRRGLEPALARQVAEQLMAHDALGAHARDELGITATMRARPAQAALASASSFAVGAALPLAAAAAAPAAGMIPIVAASSLACLVLLGALAARVGGASVAHGALRVVLWGALAMGVTAAAGLAFKPAAAADTRLERAVAAPSAPAKASGVRLLASGEEALAGLLALADAAERTIDIQQYLIADDATARVVLARVGAAAQRGVRVRILIDDLNAAGLDPLLLRLARHPNISVRLFNPFPVGRFALATRLLGGALDFRRLNHRMHNKLFLADGAVGVAGGRNIGDEYFMRNPKSNFVDLDVVVAGPAARALAASFERFWNSPQAFPAEAVADGAAETPPPAPGAASFDPAVDFIRRGIAAGRLDLTWVPVAVLADRPAKLASEGDPDAEETIADDIAGLMRSARRELVVVSPYFVPGRKGVELMAALRRQGTRVRVITNSLASTDSPFVHVGYARHRAELLRAGVELRELRPLVGMERARSRPFRSAHASLHVKALVIDGTTLFVGSMNMDPRSERINSELGLVIRSGVIARQVLAMVDEVARGSWRVELVDGALRWSALENGAVRTWDAEPEAGRMTRFGLWLASPFAPDELL